MLSDKDLYRLLRGLLDVIFGLRKLQRKFVKKQAKSKHVPFSEDLAPLLSHHEPVPRKLIPGSKVPDQEWMHSLRKGS